MISLVKTKALLETLDRCLMLLFDVSNPPQVVVDVDIFRIQLDRLRQQGFRALIVFSSKVLARKFQKPCVVRLATQGFSVMFAAFSRRPSAWFAEPAPRSCSRGSRCDMSPLSSSRPRPQRTFHQNRHEVAASIHETRIQLKGCPVRRLLPQDFQFPTRRCDLFLRFARP